MTAGPAASGAGSPAPGARRYEGKKVVRIFVAFLVIGTLVASAAAYYGHQIGAETRERFEADRAH